MSSIKAIAALAQVSQSTASLVLNGKGDRYRISAATQRKIFEAAKQLSYQPNISARRLRSGGEKVLPIIALLWTLDTRAPLMGRFLKGLQHSPAIMNERYELLVLPYIGSKLSEIDSLKTGTRFNGAIIANLTEEDERYLEETSLRVPIVLYQRQSTKYACVYVDSFQSGSDVAEKFAACGHSRVGIIMQDVSSSAVRLRLEGFLAKASELGLHVCQPVYSEFSESGGYEAIQRLLTDNEEAMPTALFITSDQMAVGALAYLSHIGKKVPDDIAIVGYDDDDVARFTVPALSTVHLPVEEMASECLAIITGLIQRQSDKPQTVTSKTYFVFRDSFGYRSR